jgi:hypothetical protein
MQPWWVTKFYSIFVGCYCVVTFLVPTILRCLLYFRKICALVMQIIWDSEVVWYRKKLPTFLVPLGIFYSTEKLFGKIFKIDSFSVASNLGNFMFQNLSIIIRDEDIHFTNGMTAFLVSFSPKSFNPLSTVVKLIIHPTQCVNLFCMTLTISCDYIPVLCSER